MQDKLITANELKQQLEDLIIDHLATGEKLPSEKEMMSMYHTSRSTLRNVIYAYESMGIIVPRQGSGYYVQMPDINHQFIDIWSILLRSNPSLMLDLLEIRSILEIHSLPQAVERINAEQLLYLGQQVNAMKEKAYQGKSFVHEDRQFHRTLFASTNNVFLEQILSAFWELYERTNSNRSHDNLVEAALQHEKILKAFAQKNLELAEKHFLEQFNDSRYQIMKSLMRL